MPSSWPWPWRRPSSGPPSSGRLVGHRRQDRAGPGDPGVLLARTVADRAERAAVGHEVDQARDQRLLRREALRERRRGAGHELVVEGRRGDQRVARVDAVQRDPEPAEVTGADVGDRGAHVVGPRLLVRGAELVAGEVADPPLPPARDRHREHGAALGVGLVGDHRLLTELQLRPGLGQRQPRRHLHVARGRDRRGLRLRLRLGVLAAAAGQHQRGHEERGEEDRQGGATRRLGRRWVHAVIVPVTDANRCDSGIWGGASVPASICAQQPTRRSANHVRTPSSGIRSWAIVSRSRTVTAPSSRVSKSTVTQYGVPISSWRR